MAAAAERDTAPRLELEGRRYVVLAEEAYVDLLKRAGTSGPDPAAWAAWEKDAKKLGQRLRDRRREMGLAQGQLARAAEIRVETLNRIERGKTSPDYGTVRRLVLALSAASRAAEPRPGRKNS